jgi:hypothetical protein
VAGCVEPSAPKERFVIFVGFVIFVPPAVAP